LTSYFLTIEGVDLESKVTYLNRSNLESPKIMASVKHLKKKVKSLCENLQNECYVELLFGTSNEIELVWSIMTRCSKAQNDIIREINAKDIKALPPKERKVYYKAITDSFYKKTLGFINDLNTIIP